MARNILMSRDEAEALVELLEEEVRFGHLNGLSAGVREAFGMSLYEPNGARMKQVHNWWFPSHELHLPVWMDHPKNRLVMNGRQAYQGRKQLAALKYCEQHRAAVDVGAHIGLWSYNMAHAFAIVHAFEPVAAHRECFEKNMVGVSQHVRLHAVALGKEAGEVSMKSEIGSSGNTTVDGVGVIPMVTLDSLEIEDVDFIKLDCEGYEENVLRGAEYTIAKWKPTIIVEQKRSMHDRFGLPHKGAITFLRLFGYKVVEEISGDFILTV